MKFWLNMSKTYLKFVDDNYYELKVHLLLWICLFQTFKKILITFYLKEIWEAIDVQVKHLTTGLTVYYLFCSFW